jgi:hypothetical protein
MNSENIPIQSTKSLINASLVAVLFAVAILFVAILPAEYGIDPTGLGKKLGLISLSESATKTSLAMAANCNKPIEAPVENSAKPATASTGSDIRVLENADAIKWQDTVKIVIPPKKGLEYKFAMVQGSTLEFSWQTDGATVYFDFHGEPKGATDGYFKSYLETRLTNSKGKLTTPFEGIHGWFWENETDQPVTITLSTNGSYEILGVM